MLSPGQWRRAVPLTLVSLVHIKLPPHWRHAVPVWWPQSRTQIVLPVQKTPNKSTNMAKTKGWDSAAAAVVILQMCICLYSEDQNGADSV